MPIVPKKMSEMITFYQQRVTQWTDNAAAIGLSAPETATIAARVTAAADSLEAQQMAKTAAKDATTVMHDAVRALSEYGADLILKIKGKAAQDGDGVYALASLPVPATPAPRPAPGKPTDFTATLGEEGGLTLKWACPNPSGASGTIYQVWRRSTPTGEFKYLGGVGAKEFADETIPAGSSQVTYQIQAARSTSVGPWAQFNVNFGVTSSGAMTATVTEGSPVNLAA